MNKYMIAIYWSDEDEAFIAEVPELAGGMADGKSYREAVANVEVVIQEWLKAAISLERQVPNAKGKLVLFD